MNIIKNEICKLLTKRTVIILLILIVLNPLIQLYTINTPNEDGYSLKNYSEVYHKISSYSRETILSEIEEEMTKANTFSEMLLYKKIYREVEMCLTYDEYLKSISEKAEEIAIMSRVVGENRYSIKNAEKTGKAYQKLCGTELSVDDPMGMLNISDNELTDYIAIIMIFVVAINLVFYEKKENQFSLLRTTVSGRKRLMVSKVFTMILLVLFIIIALYGMNAVISGLLFDSINFNSPLQSVYVYHNSPYAISIGTFLLFYFFVKTLSSVLLGIVFMLFCTIFDQIIFVFTASALTIIIELICYTRIPGTHFLAILKYMNILVGIKARGMFSDYVNLNLFEYPVNTCVLYGILGMVLMVGCCHGVINYLVVPHEKKTIAFQRKVFFKNADRHTFLLKHECYKLLIIGRGLWVLVLSLLFVVWWNPIEKMQFDSIDEVYYKEYMDKYYGPLDISKSELWNKEKKEYDQLHENIAADIMQGKNDYYISVKYKDVLDRQKAFGKFIEHAEYLEAKENGWFFWGKGYEILTDYEQAKNRDISQAMVYLIMLIAITCGIYGIDYDTEGMRILRTTYRGRKKLKNIKGILGILCTLISFVLVYIVRLVNVFNAYGIRGINAPALSMEHLEKMPQNISVLQYILIIMILRLIGGLLITKVIFMLFKYHKNSISVILSSIVLFVIPLVLASFGVPSAQYILLNPLLIGNVF